MSIANFLRLSILGCVSEWIVNNPSSCCARWVFSPIEVMEQGAGPHRVEVVFRIIRETGALSERCGETVAGVTYVDQEAT